uniref:Uncharacterized protein n=1 Tax=Nelumbo nucifera TaxID=4432 RepID=A0A822YP94_NELNU|nr:TPA_asm: hypothetical protein HUJ06_009939 [Nelumbo nucifera]
MSVVVREGQCFSRCRHTSSGKHGGGGGGREDTVEVGNENTSGSGKFNEDGDAEREQIFQGFYHYVHLFNLLSNGVLAFCQHVSLFFFFMDFWRILDRSFHS